MTASPPLHDAAGATAWKKPQRRPQNSTLEHRVGQNIEIRKHTLNRYPADPGLQVGVEEIEEHISHPQGTQFAHHEILEHPVKGARHISLK